MRGSLKQIGVLLFATLLIALVAVDEAGAKSDEGKNQLPVAAVVPADGAQAVRPDTPIEIRFDTCAQAWVHVREQLEKGHFQASLDGAPAHAVYDPDRAAVRIFPDGLLDRYTKYWVEFVLHEPDSGKHSGGGNREGWSKKTWTFSFETGSALHEPRHLKVVPSADRVRVTDEVVLELSFTDDYGQPGWGARGRVILEERGARKPGSAAAEPAEFAVLEGSDGKVKVRITDAEAEEVAYRVEISGPYPEDAAQACGELTFLPGPAAKVSLSLHGEKVVVGRKAVVFGTAEDVYGNPVEDGTPVSASASAGEISGTVTSGGGFALEFAAPTRKQAVTVTVRVDQAEAELGVPVLADVPARVTLTPEKLEAAVGTPVRIAVFVEDRYCNPVEDGTRVTVRASGATVEPAEVATQSGLAEVRVTSAQAGEVLVVASTDNGITGSAVVKFAAQQPALTVRTIGRAIFPASNLASWFGVDADGRVFHIQWDSKSNKPRIWRIWAQDWRTGEVLGGVEKLACGDNHALAIRSDGTVWTWGDNTCGQLGYSVSGSYSTAKPVPGLEDVVAVAGGRRHSLAVRSDGTVWAWGDNSRGELGVSGPKAAFSPVMVQGLTDVVSVAAGWDWSLALKRDGTVWAWGDGSYGQLGDGRLGPGVYSVRPVQVQNLTDVVAVAAGHNFGLALKRDGTVWAWGEDAKGIMGTGATGNQATPVQVQGLAGVRAIAAGWSHALALVSDGRVYHWGNICDGFNRVPRRMQGLDDVAAIAAGVWDASFAVRSDGTVWAWGRNWYGELGLKPSSWVYTPTLVTGP